VGAVVVTGAEETTAREPGLGPWDVRRWRRGVERALPEWKSALSSSQRRKKIEACLVFKKCKKI